MSKAGDQPAEPLTPAQETEKRLEEDRELCRCYKRLFASETGQIVLADLSNRFGEKKAEYIYGCTPADHAFRTGIKQPLIHIRNQMERVLKPLGRKPVKRRARSGLDKREPMAPE